MKQRLARRLGLFGLALCVVAWGVPRPARTSPFL